MTELIAPQTIERNDYELKMIKKLSRAVVSCIVCVGLLSTSVFADAVADGKRVITYDEAVKLAINNNSDLKSLADNVEYMEDAKASLVSSLGYTAANSGGTMFVESSVLAYLTSIETMANNLSISKYSEQIVKAGAEYSVFGYFTSIKGSESALELMKDSYKIAAQNVTNSQLKYNLGMISNTELEALRNELSQTKANMDNLELSIKTSYLGLSKLLGLSANTEYEIEYDIEFEKFELNTTIDSYVSKSLSNNPSLKIQEASVSTAEVNFKILPSDGPTTYEQNKLNLKEAERSYKDAKIDLENNIRTAYNQLLQLEATRSSLEAALETAKNNYNTAVINCEIGNITQLELDQAALAVKNAENDLLTNMYNYENLVFKLENTFLLGSTGA